MSSTTLNVRQGPGTGYAVTGVVHAGDVLLNLFMMVFGLALLFGVWASGHFYLSFALGVLLAVMTGVATQRRSMAPASASLRPAPPGKALPGPR